MAHPQDWSKVFGENALAAKGTIHLSPRLSTSFRKKITWNGYEFGGLKSAIQKLIRRSSAADVKKALTDLNVPWPVFFFGVEMDLYKTVTFPGFLQTAYLAKEGTSDPSADGIRTNFLNRLRVISVEDIGMGNPLLPAVIHTALPFKPKTKKDEKVKPNPDRPVQLLQVLMAEAASKKCRLISHLKTAFQLPPYYWDSTHDKTSKDETDEAKVERLRNLWLALTPHLKGIAFPPTMKDLHKQTEESLMTSFVKEVVAKKIEAFAYLSAALFGVTTGRGTTPYSKGTGTPAKNLLKKFTAAALKAVKRDLGAPTLQTVTTLQEWHRLLTHAEQPIYLYHAICLMIYRDRMPDALPALPPITEAQASATYKVNLAVPPPKEGVPFAIPEVARDIHTGAKDKDVVNFAFEGSYVSSPAEFCGDGTWKDGYRVFKMGQVSGKVMTTEALGSLMEEAAKLRDGEPTAAQLAAMRAHLKEVSKDLAPAPYLVEGSGATKPKGAQKVKASRKPRKLKGSRVMAKKRRGSRSPPPSKTKRSKSKERKSSKPKRTRKTKAGKCSLPSDKLNFLMGPSIHEISPESATGKKVKTVLETKLQGQSRCGKGKLFTYLGEDVIAKGPFKLSSAKKLVLNFGLNRLLEALEKDSGVSDAYLGGIMPEGIYRDPEGGIWIVWENVGPVYKPEEVKVHTTRIDTGFKVVDREKKDIRMSEIAKAGEMTAREAVATLQHLYFRGILMAGDSGAHNVIQRRPNLSKPIAGIDMEEIRGPPRTDSPWLFLFKSVPSKKQRPAFGPYLKDIQLLPTLSPAFKKLANDLAGTFPGCGLEKADVYEARLKEMNRGVAAVAAEMGGGEPKLVGPKASRRLKSKKPSRHSGSSRSVSPSRRHPSSSLPPPEKDVFAALDPGSIEIV